MSHFRFYQNTAPFPGTCVFSGENKNLWEVGTMTVQGQVLPVLLSDRVLIELATQAGFVTSKSYAELNAALSSRIAELEAQNNATPETLRKFQHDFNNLVSDFVTSIAGVAVPSKPVQPEADEAGDREPAAEPRPGAKSGKGKVQAAKPSDEPTVE
jgi:hypothetical protein